MPKILLNITFVILEGTLNKNFKIPKRTSHEAFRYETPLSNDVEDYHGYSVQRKWQQGATFTQYPTHYPPIQYPTPVEPITQNIWNTLNNIKEKPKNHQKNISMTD